MIALNFFYSSSHCTTWVLFHKKAHTLKQSFTQVLYQDKYENRIKNEQREIYLKFPLSYLPIIQRAVISKNSFILDPVFLYITLMGAMMIFYLGLDICPYLLSRFFNVSTANSSVRLSLFWLLPLLLVL